MQTEGLFREMHIEGPVRAMQGVTTMPPRPSLHFSSHRKMCRAIAVEWRFFEWRLFADRGNRGGRAVLVRLGTWGQRFALFLAQ